MNLLALMRRVCTWGKKVVAALDVLLYANDDNVPEQDSDSS
jgi:hypothetical protein